MNCSLSTVIGLILGAVALLFAAIGVAAFWTTAWPLLGAAALVAIVAFGMIPLIKNALLAYATCRGPSEKCSISTTVNSLGQVASFVSAGSFLIAALLQFTALAFLSNWVTALIGGTLQDIVSGFVDTGITGCVIGIVLLFAVLGQAVTFKNCMDQQMSGGT
jgi:hypothetical protein